ncbi:MAG: type II toxin-antitoxin system PemK/MazF family toxin [Clostridia bacterium]|nr:type II toxin-antitoxin system PemK/MazF family toxin [Clostridia bacterium]
MKKAYLECLKKLRILRKSLADNIDKKRGKLHFTWLKDKTEKVINEKDENYIYKNVVNYTLPNYVITQYTFNKSNKSIKNIIKKNYSFKENKYTFNNPKISVDNVKLLMRYVLFKRGNVIWLDFGFNIGKEFGGMHPAVILKNFDNDLFVVPISSKKPPEYVKIEQDLKDKKITEDECQKRKNAITEIIEISKINGFRNMLRWSRITRMKKVSILRVNFSGTIGTLNGRDMNAIAEKISIELGNKKAN